MVIIHLIFLNTFRFACWEEDLSFNDSIKKSKNQKMNRMENIFKMNILDGAYRIIHSIL